MQLTASHPNIAGIQSFATGLHASMGSESSQYIPFLRQGTWCTQMEDQASEVNLLSSAAKPVWYSLSVNARDMEQLLHYCLLRCDSSRCTPIFNLGCTNRHNFLAVRLTQLYQMQYGLVLSSSVAQG